MSAPHLSRAHDDEVLFALRLRREGRTWRYIANIMNRSAGSVQRACAAVREADEAHEKRNFRSKYE